MSDIVERLRGVAHTYDEYGMHSEIELEAANEIEKLRAALQTARRDALEEAAQYHDKLAAAQQQMFETLVDELYMTVWKTSAKNHRHYAAAIRAMDDGE
jgi:hypothetical protein